MASRVEQLHRQGLTVRAIAPRLHLDKKLVSDILRQGGKRVQKLDCLSSKSEAEKDLILKAYYNRSLTRSEIERKYGLTNWGLTKLIRQASRGKRSPHPWGNGRTLTDRQRQNLINRYSSGESIIALSKAFCVSYRITRKLIIAAGFEVGPAAPEMLPREEVRELVREYRSGKSIHTLAAEHGRDHTRISDALKASGVSVRTTAPPPTASERKKIIRLYKAGTPVSQISGETGFSCRRISRVLKQEVGPIDKLNGWRLKRAKALPKVHSLYSKGHWSANAIAKHLGIPKTLVQDIVWNDPRLINLRQMKKVALVERDAGISRDYLAGHSLRDICDRHHCGRSNVLKIVAAAKLPLREGNGWVRDTRDADQIVEDYRSGSSIDTVAQQHGCCSTVIRRILVTHKIPLRHQRKLPWSKKLLAEFHPTLNHPLVAGKVSLGSAQKLWWICPKGHVYQSILRNRYYERAGCRFCAHHEAAPETSLAAVHPEVASLWSPRNALSPDEILPGSSRKVWWWCPAGFGHPNYLRGINKQVGSGGCPKCNLRGISTSEIRLRHEISAALGIAVSHGRIPLPDGSAQADIILADNRIVLEYDGLLYHGSHFEKYPGQVRQRDLKKNRRFQAEGWRVLRVREKPLPRLGRYSVRIDHAKGPFASAVIALSALAKLEPKYVRKVAAYVRAGRCLNSTGADRELMERYRNGGIGVKNQHLAKSLDDIVALAVSGTPYGFIAKKYEVSAWSIIECLKRSGHFRPRKSRVNQTTTQKKVPLLGS